MIRLVSSLHVRGKAHAYPVIYVGHQIVTSLDIIKTADINAIEAWVASPYLMRVNSTSLAEIIFDNRSVPLTETQQLSAFFKDEMVERTTHEKRPAPSNEIILKPNSIEH